MSCKKCAETSSSSSSVSFLFGLIIGCVIAGTIAYIYGRSDRKKVIAKVKKALFTHLNESFDINLDSDFVKSQSLSTTQRSTRTTTATKPKRFKVKK